MANLWYVYALAWSFFVGRLLVTSEKTWRNIAVSLLVTVHFFLAGYIFFMDMWGLKGIDIIVLGSVVVILLLLMKIKHWTRIPLVLLLGVGGIGFLAVSVLPQFTQAPDKQRFVDNRSEVLFVFWSENADSEDKIVIQDSNQKSSFPLYKKQSYSLIFDDDIDFRFASKEIDDSMYAIYQMSDGSQFVIFPQSKVSISMSGDKQILDVKQGKSLIFLSPVSSVNESVLVDIDGKTQFVMSGQIDRNEDILSITPGINHVDGNILEQITLNNISYEQELTEFFLHEAGGEYLLNPRMQQLVEIYLNVLFTVNPENYTNSLINYKSYLEIINKRHAAADTEIFEESDIQASVKNRTYKWFADTKSFGWIQSIMDRFWK